MVTTVQMIANGSFDGAVFPLDAKVVSDYFALADGELELTEG